jgi:anthranilate phosphoribosyltransferase
MKNVLLRLYEHQYLSRTEAREILVNMGEGRYNECMMASMCRYI